MSKHLKRLCYKIIDGYAAEKSGMDDDMIPLLAELGDHALEISQLVDALNEKAELALAMSMRMGQAQRDLTRNSEEYTATLASIAAQMQEMLKRTNELHRQLDFEQVQHQITIAERNKLRSSLIR